MMLGTYIGSGDERTSLSLGELLVQTLGVKKHR